VKHCAPVRRVLLLLLCLSAISPALADNTADEADIAFQLGNEAYARRAYAEALRNYFLSYRLVPNRNVLFNIARCYESARRFDEAYRYFHDLSRQELTTEDAAEVASALRRILPRVALVEVTSTPSGAAVYADREDLGSRGVTPLRLALPAGKHVLRVKLAGHVPAQAELQLSPGKVVAQPFALEPLLGVVVVTGRPEGAEVRASPEGPVLGRVPGEVKLPVGRRTLYLSLSGHAPAAFPMEVEDKGSARLDVALAPEAVPTGTLLVTANRDAALVRVDGREAGFTPAALTLRAGEHTVEVLHPETRTFTAKVALAKDGSEKLHAELRYAPPPVQAASKRLLSVDDAPASTTVLTREELQAFGYSSLVEALQAVRGIFLTNDRQYEFLGIRGFSPPGDLNTRVLILWDGHAMNDVWAGQGYAGRDLSIDLEEVERIEVVRGPGSALYGTGAFFAVINVVPRDRVDAGRTVEATGAAGANGMFRARATGSVGSRPDLGLTLSAGVLDAYGAEKTNLRELGTVRGLDGERVYTGSVRARASGFTFQGYVNARTKQVPTAPYGAAVGLAGTATRDVRGFAELRYDHDFSPGASLSARAYYDQSHYVGTWVRPREEGTDEGADSDLGEAQWTGAEVRGRFALFRGNTLTAGAEAQSQFRIRHTISTPENDDPVPELRGRTLLSAYLLDEWQVVPGRLSLTAGLRVDRYLDLSVTPLTPRLALIARPYEGGLTKLVGGSAFRAPNIYELYYSEGSTQRVPTSGLDPETIQTLELEHSHDLSDELRLTVGGYFNSIQKLVVAMEEAGPPGCGIPAGTSACVVNSNLPGTVRAWGAEAELRWQPGRHTLVDLTYAWVNSSVPNHPAHVASGKVLVPLVGSAVRLSSQAVFQSARRTARVPDGAGEALLVNVGISGQREHLRYFAGVTNLLDVQYSLPVNDEYRQATVPQFGRGFLVQLSGSY
jgi:outer membrane receptor for ferrienterochelin and colicins